MKYEDVKELKSFGCVVSFSRPGVGASFPRTGLVPAGGKTHEGSGTPGRQLKVKRCQQPGVPPGDFGHGPPALRCQTVSRPVRVRGVIPVCVRRVLPDRPVLHWSARTVVSGGRISRLDPSRTASALHGPTRSSRRDLPFQAGLPSPELTLSSGRRRRSPPRCTTPREAPLLDEDSTHIQPSLQHVKNKDETTTLLHQTTPVSLPARRRRGKGA